MVIHQCFVDGFILSESTKTLNVSNSTEFGVESGIILKISKTKRQMRSVN